MSIFHQPISETVWDIKYRYRHDGQIIDHTIEDTWRRIAKAVASVEATNQRKFWEKSFYEILGNFSFLPGGRIIAGAGAQRKVTLLNCFVMNIAEDSLHGIFQALEEGAFTLQQGGGIGYDFSILRPHGEATDQTESIASGPISFMRIWDAMSATMQSSGARRGAMMGHLRCDHPDIEKFIDAKADPTQLRQFNVSVIITDEFMRAVKKDAEWALVFPVSDKKISPKEKTIERHWSKSNKPVTCRVFRYVKARALWERIIKAAYNYAEPGVIFEDTINRMNNLWYCEWIHATNPCGEIPLPAYGACNLGSINLTQFVLNPFTPQAQFDLPRIEATAEIATRFLDNVISLSKYPLPIQKHTALATRRIGLGFTGLADALVMLGEQYGSAPSLKTVERIMQLIAYATWNGSIALAKERGSFPSFKKKLYLQGKFVEKLPKQIRDHIGRFGMRNSHHNAIAPTGTISLLANNVSTGLEPIFSPHYQRRVRTVDGNMLEFKTLDYAIYLWRQRQEKNLLPPAWVDTQTLMPEDHLKIQGVVQPYIDNAISKTINLPEDFPFEKLNAVYTQAYELGLKGCTVFRPNPVTGSILSVEDVDLCCPPGK